MPQTEPSILRVEGKDDFHAINHLLLRHGIDCAKIPVDIKSADGGDETTGGRNALLDLMQTEVMTNTNRSVGFILDADEDAKDRWSAVCARLRNVGIRLPDEIPQDGFVGKATMVQAHVGVWLMPDNRTVRRIGGVSRGPRPQQRHAASDRRAIDGRCKGTGRTLSPWRAAQGRVARVARVASETGFALWLGHTRPLLRSRQRRRPGVRRVV